MKTFVIKVALKEEEDGRWSVSIPGLPGCSSWGYSREEALNNIKDAAEIYIEDMMDAKDTLPPGTLQNFLIGTKWNEDDLKRLGLTT